eukprot:PhF_6_TR33593/c0_g1_i1/m.49041
MAGSQFNLNEGTILHMRPVRDYSTNNLRELQQQLIDENGSFPPGIAPPRIDELIAPKMNSFESSAMVMNLANTTLTEEQNQLMEHCIQLDKRKQEIQKQLRDLRHTLDDSRRKEMEGWEKQRTAFQLKMAQLQKDWETERATGLKIDAEIEDQRVEVLQKWHSNCKVLFNIWSQDRNEWEREKSELLASALKKKGEDPHDERNSRKEELLNQIQSKKESVLLAQRDVKDLRDTLVTSRARTEECRLMVGNATAMLEDVRQKIQKQCGDPNVSRQIVGLVTECEIDRERSKQLKASLEVLTAQLQQETAIRKNLHNVLEDMKGNVRVILRMRPLLPSELSPSEQQKHMIPLYQEEGSVETLDETTVRVTTPTMGGKTYDFYRVLDNKAHQENVYDEIAPLMISALDGYNVCILAYGQTGSGKTYTILGDGTANGRGVVQRSIEDLFDRLNHLDPEMRWKVSCSMIELYLDDVKDMLGNQNEPVKINLNPTNHGFAAGVKYVDVNTAAQAIELMQRGVSQRQVHATLMNPESSRSHTMFTMLIRIEHGTKVKTSKVVFVDLAGSERVSKSHSRGDRLKEAMQINKSLSALGDVISALSSRQPDTFSGPNSSNSFVPYRNSKLTMLLQDCIGGNSKTLMCACVCPGTPWSTNLSETISTLNFASRVKNVRNNITRNSSTTVL